MVKLLLVAIGFNILTILGILWLLLICFVTYAPFPEMGDFIRNEYNHRMIVFAVTFGSVQLTELILLGAVIMNLRATSRD